VDNQMSCRRIIMQTDLSPNLPPVNSDASQLQQIIINLLVNAADAIGNQGGTIYLKTKSVPIEGHAHIQFEITDTGCGIAEENLSKIFEPFYSTKEQKGTGLGLAVVWGIIDEHGGKITADSELGKGSTFTIQLPVAEATSPIIKA
jgi:two-component system NtrC family sensor kinase